VSAPSHPTADGVSFDACVATRRGSGGGKAHSHGLALRLLLRAQTNHSNGGPQSHAAFRASLKTAHDGLERELRHASALRAFGQRMPIVRLLAAVRRRDHAPAVAGDCELSPLCVLFSPREWAIASIQRRRQDNH